jgi:hypothetical protein
LQAKWQARRGRQKRSIDLVYSKYLKALLSKYNPPRKTFPANQLLTAISIILKRSLNVKSIFLAMPRHVMIHSKIPARKSKNLSSHHAASKNEKNRKSKEEKNPTKACAKCTACARIEPPPKTKKGESKTRIENSDKTPLAGAKSCAQLAMHAYPHPIPDFIPSSQNPIPSIHPFAPGKT